MTQILTPKGYFQPFMTPRAPQRHQVQIGRFLPLERLRPALEALAIPVTRKPYQVLHTFNRIPLTGKPWLVTFESRLPRSFRAGSDQIRAALRGQLLRPNCGAVIAISEAAWRRFELENAGWDGLETVRQKHHVIHPNLPLRRNEPKRLGRELHLLFVGRAWAHKGGVVAVRLAREALKRGLPIHVTVVSSLDMHSHAQHQDIRQYDDDLKLLNLLNVTHHRELPNAEVLRLMDGADFTLLHTAHDTYGYSVLESMAAGTPAIVTRAGALIEVVQDNENGFALPLELNHLSEYAQVRATDWDTWNDFYTRLAEQTLDRLETLLEQPQEYERLSAGAIERIKVHHEADKIGRQLELIYDQVASPVSALNGA